MDWIDKNIEDNLNKYNERSREIKVFLIQYFCSAFFYGLNFIAPFLVIILNETLTASQISFVIIVQSISKLLFEIPSGPLADKFGKKRILVFGQILYIAVFVILAFDRSFYPCVIAYAIWGACIALFTGTETALFYNNMKFYKIDKNYSIYNGRYDTISIITAALTSLLSAFLYKKFGYNALLLCHLVFSAFGYFVLIAFIKDREGKINKISANKNYVKILKDGLNFLFKHTTLFKLFVFLVAWNSIWFILKEFNGLFLKEIIEDSAMVGVLDSVQKFMIAFSQFFIISTFSNIKTKVNMYFLVIASLFFLFSCIFYDFPNAFIFLSLFWIISNMVYVIINAKLQEYTPSKIRSTIGSLLNFLYAIGKIILLIIFGIINTNYSYKAGFISFAILQILICASFSIILTKDKHINKNE